MLEAASGMTLDWFFDQWVYHARFPDLKIKYRWLPGRKLAKLEIEQTQNVLPMMPAGKGLSDLIEQWGGPEE